VGFNSVADGESSSEEALEMLNFANVSEKSAINTLLDSFKLSSPFSLSLLVSFNSFQSKFRGILKLVLGESAVIFKETVINVGIDSSEGNSGGGSNHVSGVDSSERNSVDCIRSSNE